MAAVIVSRCSRRRRGQWDLSDDVLGFAAADAEDHFRDFVSCGALGEGGAFVKANELRNQFPLRAR